MLGLMKNQSYCLKHYVPELPIHLSPLSKRREKPKNIHKAQFHDRNLRWLDNRVVFR